MMLFIIVQVFHRRSTGFVLFQRKWVEYENGFGNPPTDYWIGLAGLPLMFPEL